MFDLRRSTFEFRLLNSMVESGTHLGSRWSNPRWDHVIFLLRTCSLLSLWFVNMSLLICFSFTLFAKSFLCRCDLCFGQSTIHPWVTLGWTYVQVSESRGSDPAINNFTLLPERRSASESLQLRLLLAKNHAMRLAKGHLLASPKVEGTRLATKFSFLWWCLVSGNHLRTEN